MHQRPSINKRDLETGGRHRIVGIANRRRGASKVLRLANVLRCCIVCGVAAKRGAARHGSAATVAAADEEKARAKSMFRLCIK